MATITLGHDCDIPKGKSMTTKTASVTSQEHQKSVGTGACACAHIVLYGADGEDKDLALEDVRPLRDHREELLWIDIDCDAPDVVNEVCTRLELPPEVCTYLTDLSSTPQVRNFDSHFFVQVVAVEHVGSLEFAGAVLGIAAGAGHVVSVHHKPITFIPEIRDRESGHTRLGQLNSSSFVASLLDWQLGTYFIAVSEFERCVETLEEAVLHEKRGQSIADLRELRKGASRLRRMLSPHRQVFSSLARPDFRPDDDEDANRNFKLVGDHFERAMDVVENARDLVIGSFELYSNQIAIRTNETMRALTFFTVVIGFLAVIAGILGMNFEAPLFKLSYGFEYALGAMCVLAIAAFVTGKRKKWF
ncbi:MAG: CorA family divalent cation transporter [Luteimonas sp.]